MHAFLDTSRGESLRGSTQSVRAQKSGLRHGGGYVKRTAKHSELELTAILSLQTQRMLWAPL